MEKKLTFRLIDSGNVPFSNQRVCYREVLDLIVLVNAVERYIIYATQGLPKQSEASFVCG